MTTVIALANQKGGVGKTTSTVNLASALVHRGQRVSAIDMDPQSSLTIYLGHDPRALEQREATLYWALIKDQDLASLARSEEALAAADHEKLLNLYEAMGLTLGRLGVGARSEAAD